MSSNNRALAVTLAAVGQAAVLGLLAPAASAQAPRSEAPKSGEVAPLKEETPVGDTRSSATRVAAVLGPHSRLPYTGGADVWVDAHVMDPGAIIGRTVPGAQPAQRASVLVFRPARDLLRWEDFAQLYVSGGLIPAGAAPALNAAAIPQVEGAAPGAPLNAKDIHVYRGRTADEMLVLGIIRNLRTQHILGFSVLLTGRLDGAQAMVQANLLVEKLAGDAQRLRSAPPVPPGAVPSRPEQRLTDQRLRQMMTAILRDPTISPRVKEMAQAVMPRATALTFSVWRTPAPMTDKTFVDFYTQEASRRGWGLPVSKDETQRGRPTLLFQRPNGEGMMMVRAQPAPGGTVGGRLMSPGTTLFVLMMEGKGN